jgi:competence protein ComEC
VIKYLRSNLLKERSSWFLWTPIFLGVGILIYFKLLFEPSYNILAYPVFFILLLSLIIGNTDLGILLLKALILILFGFILIMYKSNNLPHNQFRYDNIYSKIQGRVLDIQPLSKGVRAIITNPIFENSKISTNVKKIRVTFKHQKIDFNIGDNIIFHAFLSKPPPQITPYSYNFARYAFFEQIEAVGISTTKIDVLHNNISFFSVDYINHLRNLISQDLLTKYGNKTGSVIASLMIGEYTSIDRKLLDDMRISGLAHILSVSGLHLTLVTGIIFISIRLLLNMVKYTSLEWNTKKIAACCAIIISFLYLLMSGSSIAAIRSFIMTTTVLIAIIIDRDNRAIRSVMIAAIIVLIINPEFIVHPSFQMSFSAVIALISCYEYITKNNLIQFSQHNLFYKIIFYFISSILTSFIAGFAIAPYSAYHFGQFSKYSILANLLVVPIVSFFIMPLVILALLLYPTFLKSYILELLKYGIDYLNYIATIIAEIPHSSVPLSFIPDASIALITIGGLWLLLWQRNWRFFGLIPCFIGLLLPYFNDKPDIIITQDPNLFTITDNDNELIISKKVRSELKFKSLKQLYGNSKYHLLNQYAKNLDYQCFDDLNLCKFVKNKKIIIFDYNKYYNYTDCSSDLIFLPNSWKVQNNCDVKIITARDLKNHGTYLIYLQKKLKLINIHNANGHRFWNSNLWNRQNNRGKK